ncbi:MAG TPA: hypothetical protein VEP49_06470 [Acidimicrobiia bacterium]|nr:hypothetical protein [Acidimicrobiia bacterium]
MAHDEVRTRLRRRLAEEYGMDEADLLLDRPPGGWDAIVTKDWLHLELGALGARLDAIDRRFEVIDRRFESIDQRFVAIDGRLSSIDERLDALQRGINTQTWRLIAAITAVLGVLVAAIEI